MGGQHTGLTFWDHIRPQAALSGQQLELALERALVLIER
jgi:hypothetical protein